MAAAPLRAAALTPALQALYAQPVSAVLRLVRDSGAQLVLIVKLSAGRAADRAALAERVRAVLVQRGELWREVDGARPWKRGLHHVTLFAVAAQGDCYAAAASAAHATFHQLNVAMFDHGVTAGLGTIQDWLQLAAGDTEVLDPPYRQEYVHMVGHLLEGGPDFMEQALLHYAGFTKQLRMGFWRPAQRLHLEHPHLGFLDAMQQAAEGVTAEVAADDAVAEGDKEEEEWRQHHWGDTEDEAVLRVPRHPSVRTRYDLAGEHSIMIEQITGGNEEPYTAVGEPTNQALLQEKVGQLFGDWGLEHTGRAARLDISTSDAMLFLITLLDFGILSVPRAYSLLADTKLNLETGGVYASCLLRCTHPPLLELWSKYVPTRGKSQDISSDALSPIRAQSTCGKGLFLLGEFTSDGGLGEELPKSMLGRENATGSAVLTYCAKPRQLILCLADCLDAVTAGNGLQPVTPFVNQRDAGGSPTMHQLTVRGSHHCALVLLRQDDLLREAVGLAANPTFIAALLRRLGARSIYLSAPRKAAHVRSLAQRGALATPLQVEQGEEPLVCAPSAELAPMRRQRLAALNFNTANLKECTLLSGPGGLRIPRVAALGMMGGSYNDAIAEYLVPGEMERPAAAYSEARKHANAVHMGQRVAAGGSRDGSGKAIVSVSLPPVLTMALQRLVKADLGSTPNTREGLQGCYDKAIPAHATLCALVHGMLAGAQAHGTPHMPGPLPPSAGRGYLAQTVLEVAVAARGGYIASIKASELVRAGAQQLLGSARHAADIVSSYGQGAAKASAAVLDEALSSFELLRVVPEPSKRANAGVTKFAVTGVSVGGAGLAVLSFSLVKSKAVPRADVCATSSLGEAYNAQARTALEDVRFQRVPLGALQASFARYPAEMAALSSLEADLRPGSDGGVSSYGWRCGLRAGEAVHLMGGPGALHGVLLASGSTVGTCGAGGAAAAPALLLPTRSGAPAGTSRVLVRLGSVHPAAAAALGGRLAPGQEWMVGAHTAMLQPRTPSQEVAFVEAAASEAAAGGLPTPGMGEAVAPATGGADPWQQQQQQEQQVAPAGLPAGGSSLVTPAAKRARLG